jgi:hypothetical protein
MAFWMGVASAQHARGGRDGGFAQLGHGKHIAVKSLRKGDWIVYYSPREGMAEGEAVQAFTTLGRVTSESPYRIEQAMNPSLSCRCGLPEGSRGRPDQAASG